MGWTAKGTKYCQMIREVNKKRLKWATENHTFESVIFETTVQMETHRRTCCYKRGCKPRYKPKPKHPVMVHVWAGISSRGRSRLTIFEGKMNAPLFISTLRQSLIPFIKTFFQMATALSKTMIRNIVQSLHANSMKMKGSTGGRHLLNLQT